MTDNSTHFDPYQPPHSFLEEDPETLREPDPDAREPIEVWFKCWMGIGAGGLVLIIFEGRFQSLFLVGFMAGLVTSSIVFPAAVFLVGSPLRRRVSIFASLVSAQLAAIGTAVALFPYENWGKVALVTIGTSILFTPGAMLSELTHWERVDHKRVTRMAKRFREIPDTLDRNIHG